MKPDVNLENMQPGPALPPQWLRWALEGDVGCSQRLRLVIWSLASPWKGQGKARAAWAPSSSFPFLLSFSPPFSFFSLFSLFFLCEDPPSVPVSAQNVLSLDVLGPYMFAAVVAAFQADPGQAGPSQGLRWGGEGSQHWNPGRH